MEYRILGPLEVVDNGRSLSLGGTRQRALLAMLLLHANRVVSTDQLLDELWGENQPETGAKALQVAVSQLRKSLQSTADSDGFLLTRAPGYVLRVGEGQLDLDRFERLVEEARASPDAELRATKLREALALWRGPPLADLSYESFAGPATARLEEARLAAIESRIEAELALGRHAALVGELEELTRQHPLRERLQMQFMLALYRSGRQAEALNAYGTARRMLVDELGIEPSPEMQKLQRAILEHDPALEAPVPAPAPVHDAPRVRRLGLAAAAAAVLVVLAAVAAVLLTRGEAASGVAVTPSSLVAIDPQTNEVVSSLRLSRGIGAVAFGEGSVWVANSRNRTVDRVDPGGNEVVSTIGLGIGPDTVAVGDGSVWVAEADFSNPSAGFATLTRIDPAANEPRATVRLDPHNPLRGGGEPVVAAGGGAVWVGNSDGPKVLRVDPHSLRVEARVKGVDARGLALGLDAVWVVEPLDRVVTAIDPESTAVRGSIPVGVREPSSLAVGEGSVWVTDLAEDTLWRVDPRTQSVVVTIPTGDGPTGVAASDGAVWVANRFGQSISRIDPVTNTVVATIDLGHDPRGIAVGGGSIWVIVE